MEALLSWSNSSTGFCAPHTAASSYPSWNSLSRIASSAGSRAQLNSCRGVIVRSGILTGKTVETIIGNGMMCYLTGACPIIRIAIGTNSDPL